MKNVKILVVDDEENIRLLFKEELEHGSLVLEVAFAVAAHDEPREPIGPQSTHDGAAHQSVVPRHIDPTALVHA